MPDVEVTRETLLCLQICSRLSLEESRLWGERRLCGTMNGWKLSEREGIEQGVTCKEYPNRKHYLFDC